MTENDSEATEPIPEWEQENGRTRKAAASDTSSPADFIPGDGSGMDTDSVSISSTTLPQTDAGTGSITADVKIVDTSGGSESDKSEHQRDLSALIDTAEKKSTPLNGSSVADKSTAGSTDQPSNDALEKSGDTGVRRASGRTTAEQSGSYAYPDSGAASSQRMRPIPPDRGKKTPWWVRHKHEIMLVELALTGLFFLLTLYFLFMWIFSKPEMACVPQSSWKVPAVAGQWRNIVVHHTATERSSPESIDRYHREVRKWEGLGYHFLIGNGRSNGRDPTLGNGEVHVGVRWREQRNGAHVRMKEFPNANSFSIGIALIGNFEKEPPTPQQVAALRCLLGFLMKEYSIPKSGIVGHGDVSAQYTACPGNLIPLEKIIASL